MPAIYNLPRASNLWDVQDVNLYNKLPFYLANLSAKYFPMWAVWNKLVGSIPWQPNMGTTMKGVRAEPTPIGRQTFFPNDITAVPKKDTMVVNELTETATIKHHLFESPYMHFLPSFQDFRRDQIGFAMQDLSQQIMVANDFFIRSVIFHASPVAYVVGKTTDGNGEAEVTSCPTNAGADDGSTGKTSAFLQNLCAQIGSAKGNLSIKALNKSLNIMREDIQAPGFSGMFNVPKDNETIKGNYVFVGGSEAYGQLTFDEHILQYKDLNRDLVNDEFKGILFGSLAYKLERFPMRIAVDGTFPAPQTVQGSQTAYNFNEGPVPNPAYVSAPYEVGFILGSEPYRAIAIGAPPKEFASGSMSTQKFNQLFWNGEVRLTDDLIINYGNNNLDTNKYGEFVQLISKATMGIIPVNRRFCMPVIYRRWRVQTN